MIHGGEVNIDRGTIGKLLVIKLRAVGDVILSTAILPNLRAAFPDATIDFLVERSCRDVIEGNDRDRQPDRVLQNGDERREDSPRSAAGRGTTWSSIFSEIPAARS